jgi:hypothetical protein
MLRTYALALALGAALLLPACYGKHLSVTLPIPPGLKEAPVGFDLNTNGFESQADRDRPSGCTC